MRVQDLTRVPLPASQSREVAPVNSKPCQFKNEDNDFMIQDAVPPALVFPSLSLLNRTANVFGFLGDEVNQRVQNSLDSISVFFVSIFGLMCFNDSREANKKSELDVLQASLN